MITLVYFSIWEGGGTEEGIGCEIQFCVCTRVNCIEVISFSTTAVVVHDESLFAATAVWNSVCNILY